jgi:hypothetical protein
MEQSLTGDTGINRVVQYLNHPRDRDIDVLYKEIQFRIELKTSAP